MALGKHNISSGIHCILRRQLLEFLTPHGWSNRHYTSNCLPREHFCPAIQQFPSTPPTAAGRAPCAAQAGMVCASQTGAWWARAQGRSRDVGASRHPNCPSTFLAPSPLPLGRGITGARGSHRCGRRPVTPGFSPPAWGSGTTTRMVAAAVARPAARSRHGGAC